MYSLALLALCAQLVSSSTIVYPRQSTDAITSVSAAAWRNLNTTVSGRLQQGIPYAQPCFEMFNGQSITPNRTLCASRQENYNVNQLRSDMYGAMLRPQWETCQSTGEGCTLDSTEPSNPLLFQPPAQCMQGVLSPYYIDVRGSSDISAAFKFSKDTGVPISIKNTGHDFQGRSAQKDSLALWTHNLRDTLTYTARYVPEKCKVKPVQAITYSAGYQWLDVYRYADTQNVTVVGGASQTVGAGGGFIQSAGHGPLSPALGLAIDRVLQFRVVTPDGRNRVANECQNTDLFWALRGGGGGTFGVVTEVSVKADPRVTIQVFTFDFSAGGNQTRNFLKAISDHTLKWAKEGWSAYISATSVAYINPKLSSSQASQSMEPLVAFTRSVNGTFQSSEAISFLSFYTQNNVVIGGSDGASMPLAIGGRFIPDTNFKTEDSRNELADTLAAFADSVEVFSIVSTMPYGSPQRSDVSASSSWRTSPWHVTSGATFPSTSSVEAVRDKYRGLSTALEPLRAITPGAGAYNNEADIFEPDFVESFWGTKNYKRLLDIKKKYDPRGILSCWHCVGWTSVDDPRYQCYPQ